MMKEIKLCTGSMKEKMAFFDKVIGTFSPVEEVVSFFHSANFLCTDYQLTDNNTTTIIKNKLGDEIHFDGFTCGSDDEGSHGLIHVLVTLGMTEQFAENLAFEHNALTIRFDSEGKYTVSRNSPLHFVNREMGSTKAFSTAFQLGDFCHVQLSDRQVYLLNPEVNSLPGVFDALEVMQPIEIEFCTGRQSLWENNGPFSSVFQRGSSLFHTQKYPVNLIIYGRRFTLVCAVQHSMVKAMVQSLHVYLTGKIYFDDHLLAPGENPSGKIPLFRRLRFALKLAVDKEDVFLRRIRLPRQSNGVEEANCGDGPDIKHKEAAAPLQTRDGQ